MARVIKAPNVFPLLNLLVSESVHDFAGSVHEVTLPQPVSSEWIGTRTIMTRGSARFEFPGTNVPAVEVDAPGAVLPGALIVTGKTQVKMTMLTDNVEVQCVAPQPGYKIQVREIDLELGAVLDIEKGVMMFIFGNNYFVNDNKYSSFEMFAVQYNDVTINALSPCHVVIFNSVPKGV